MADSIRFPSTDWLSALASRMHRETDSFRAFGPIDCTMVVKVNDGAEFELFEVAFQSFEVRSIRKLDGLKEAADEHFVIEASLEVWREMIDNIRANDGPDLEHTLNYLTFPDDPMLISGPDQLQVDAFYRYNASLQQFFNGAAAVETTYP